MTTFHRRTLMPDSAVASSLLPIEYVYRPSTVLLSSTAAIANASARTSTALGKLTPNRWPVEIFV